MNIPPEIEHNVVDGAIERHSKFANKTGYGLFMTEENRAFLIQQFTVNPETILNMITHFRNSKLDDSGTIASPNPLIVLSRLNTMFIRETLKVLSSQKNHGNDYQDELLNAQVADRNFVEVDWGTRNKFNNNENGRNVYRWGNRIPPDRVSMHHRPYERDITDSLRDTRQLESFAGGYDMSGLTNHSSNNLSSKNTSKNFQTR